MLFRRILYADVLKKICMQMLYAVFKWYQVFNWLYICEIE